MLMVAAIDTFVVAICFSATLALALVNARREVAEACWSTHRSPTLWVLGVREVHLMDIQIVHLPDKDHQGAIFWLNGDDWIVVISMAIRGCRARHLSEVWSQALELSPITTEPCGTLILMV